MWSSEPLAFNPIVAVGLGLNPGGQDMSLQKNVAGQNVAFLLVNAADDTAFTGASFSGAAWWSKDGVQAAAAGTFTELSPTGKAIYNYAPTQAETNCNCGCLWVMPTGAVPEFMLFLTNGLHKNVAGQHVTFGMMTTAGVSDPSASPTITVSKDGGSLSTGGGTTTNLTNGQYDYLLTQAETNGINVNISASATGDVSQNISIFTVI